MITHRYLLVPILVLFLTVMGLPCGPQALESTGSVAAVCGLSCSKTCGILVPQPGFEPEFPELQGGFLTTGLPGKSPVPV